MLLLTVQSIDFHAFGAVEVIWSDNFDGDDLVDWRIEGAFLPLSGVSYETNGRVENVDNVMRFSGDLKFRNFSIIVHESHLAYGSWSWDWNVVSNYGSSNQSHVYFIDSRNYDDSHQFSNGNCCFDVLASSSNWSTTLSEVPDYAKEIYELSPGFFLFKRQPFQTLSYWQTENIDGWWHIDISRNETGYFKVYINDTLRMEAQDNSHGISNSLWMNAETGSNIGFDNFVVRNTTDFITTSSLNTPTNKKSASFLQIQFFVVIMLSFVWKYRKNRQSSFSNM